MINLKNKKALITGIASDRSIAAGIAKTLSQNGVDLVLTYQNDKLKSRVEKIGEQLESNTKIFPCDLSSDEDINHLYDDINKLWGEVDIIVHSAAFALREELSGNYLDNISRKGFQIAHDISSYSFTALGKKFNSIINDGGSLVTLTYLGSQRVVKNYNIMGLAKASLEASVRYMASSLGGKNIRVNGVSAGPIKTLAASGISGFGEILKHVEEKSPLKRNITQDEISNTVAFLVSDLSSGITGQIIYVDSGYNILAV